MSYLGLDLSTSVCGYCRLNLDGSYSDSGYIDLKKYKTLYEKLDIMEDFLEMGNSTKIFIEEPAMAFSVSTAWTISLLQRFNGMVSGLIYTKLNIEPILINASHARKLCGIKNIKGQKTKDIAFEHIKSLNIIPESKWEYKKNGNVKDCMKDMTDATVIAIAGYLEHK